MLGFVPKYVQLTISLIIKQENALSAIPLVLIAPPNPQMTAFHAKVIYCLKTIDVFRYALQVTTNCLITAQNVHLVVYYVCNMTLA